MPKITKVVLQCDACPNVIDPDAHYSYVNAMVYGAVFHRECWTAMGGPVVARALGLDEVEICRTDGGTVIEKAWASR